MERTFKNQSLHEESCKDNKFQNSEYAVLFLDPELLNKSGIRFVIRWILLKKFKILILRRNFMGGILKISILSIKDIKLTQKTLRAKISTLYKLLRRRLQKWWTFVWTATAHDRRTKCNNYFFSSRNLYFPIFHISIVKTILFYSFTHLPTQKYW
jgi:hypothetical protein